MQMTAHQHARCQRACPALTLTRTDGGVDVGCLLRRCCSGPLLAEHHLVPVLFAVQVHCRGRGGAGRCQRQAAGGQGAAAPRSTAALGLGRRPVPCQPTVRAMPRRRAALRQVAERPQRPSTLGASCARPAVPEWHAQPPRTCGGCGKVNVRRQGLEAPAAAEKGGEAGNDRWTVAGVTGTERAGCTGAVCAQTSGVRWQVSALCKAAPCSDPALFRAFVAPCNRSEHCR